MANYNLIMNARFRPFSYSELLNPVLMATQAHQALEQEYSELSNKSSVWEHMANEQTDPDTYKMYKAYADDLEKRAGQLAREGLNTLSRRNLMDMKSRYSKEIVPIENAYKARADEIKEQLAGKAQGMVYEGDASLTSLDRYLKDPSIKYRYANSREGYNRLGTAAKALSTELRNSLKTGKLDAYTNTLLQQFGYASNEIGQAISDIEAALRGDGNPRGTNILTSLLADEMNTSGVNDWGTAAKMDYYNRVAPALYQAVGQTKISTYDNYAAKLAAKAAYVGKHSNEDSAPGSSYRRMTGLNVNNAEETKMAKEDLKFLRKIQANPELLRKTTIRKSDVVNVLDRHPISGRRVGGFSDPAFTTTFKIKENYERLKAIEKKYGITVTGLRANEGYGDEYSFYKGYGKKLEKAISDRIAKGVVTDDIWQSNTSDDEWVTKGWVENGKTAVSHFSKVDMWKYEDGRAKKRLTKEDLDKIDTKDSHYYTYIDKNDKVRIIMNYTDADGKSQSVEVGDMLIGNNDITKRKDLIEYSLKHGRTDMVPRLMDDIHTILYGVGNTRAYTQGKTDSKLSPYAPYDYNSYVDMLMEE